MPQNQALDSRFDVIELRLGAIDSAQKANALAIEEGNRDVREMLEIFAAVKGGFKVLGWLATALRWAGWIAGACAAFYAAWHALIGGSPKP